MPQRASSPVTDYATLLLHVILPVLLGGVCNMAFVKSRWLDGLKRPIDGGGCASDGRRWLGANKTWKGFLGMVACSALWALLIDAAVAMFLFLGGAGLPRAPLSGPLGAGLGGALFGLAYVLAELPNSFIKRRLDIAPGANARGWCGALFIVIDQVDSVLGCLLAAMLVMPLHWRDAAMIVLFCGALHLLVNQLLFRLKLKSQPF